MAMLCLEFSGPLENFSLIWRCHHCQWRVSNFDLRPALMAIEQWEFLSMPHLLWHRASVYYGHLRGPLTLTLIAERLSVELSLPVLRLRSAAAGIRTPNLPFAGPTIKCKIILKNINIICVASGDSSLTCNFFWFEYIIEYSSWIHIYICLHNLLPIRSTRQSWFLMIQLNHSVIIVWSISCNSPLQTYIGILLYVLLSESGLFICTSHHIDMLLFSYTLLNWFSNQLAIEKCSSISFYYKDSLHTN